MKVIKPSVEIIDSFDGQDVMLRTSPAAHPQMKEVAELLLKELKAKIPVVFDDIKQDCDNTFHS